MIHSELGNVQIKVTDKEMKLRGVILRILNELEVHELTAENKNLNDEATCYSDLCSIYLAMIAKFGERTATKLTIKAMQECYHNYISISSYPKENNSDDL